MKQISTSSSVLSCFSKTEKSLTPLTIWTREKPGILTELVHFLGSFHGPPPCFVSFSLAKFGNANKFLLREMDRRHAYDSTNVLEEATGRQLIRFSVLTFFKNRKKVNLILITHIIQLPASYQYLIWEWNLSVWLWGTAKSWNDKNHHSRHYGGNEGCYLLLVGVSMKNQFGIIGINSW